MELSADTIDLPALREQLNLTAASISKLKRLLRQTWTRPMADEQRALWALKDKATLLCILRAHMRGKYHLRAPMRRGWYPGKPWEPQEYHRQTAERAADRYNLIVSPAETAAGGER